MVTGVEIALTMFGACIEQQFAKNASNWSRITVCF